ncbi:MAG: glycosyltransferase [Methanoregula sp.]|jgi:glycosyltransferase involved in cell wall biosynthesis|uniref:glycosyltransferase n=1 Tax=Methanoregula sp. TaxID=2052170 RepID=UPI003C1EC346
MRISVVIPVKNEETKIVNCLKAVFNQTLQPFEVIMVDGHSSDKTVENAQQFPITLLYEEYKTVGGARQVGLENAKGDYIAFTDADCIPSETWLENLHKSFSEGNQQKIMGVGGGIKNIGESVLEKSIFLVFNTYLGSADSVQDRFFNDTRFIKSFCGCNCMYRRSDLIEAGGYNTTLSLCEDSDMDERLIKKGNLLYIPDAIVLHDQTLTLSNFMERNYSFGYGRGRHHFWDLQVIPPVLGLMTLIFLFTIPVLFIAMISLYFLILFAYDILIFIKEKRVIYLLTLPVVFIIEHVMYSIGFWVGLFASIADISNKSKSLHNDH